MSNQNTVFIVGAGASTDFGFPVGVDLQSEIANFLRPHRHNDLPLHKTVLTAADELKKRDSTCSLIEHCQWIANTLPLYPSIDAFLDKNSQSNDITSFLGKLAIVSIIAERESRSGLVTSKSEGVGWSNLSKSWIAKLWSLSNSGGFSKKLENPLPGISFITFNYDRCIEQFITLAIMQSYRCSFEDAFYISQNVPCEHVYGSLGPIFDASAGPLFGSAQFPSQIIPLSDKIKTFTEQTDSDTRDRIRSILNNAQRVIFLGFSFAKINQSFFSSVVGEIKYLKQVFGTASGMSDQDKSIAENWSDTIFRRQTPGSKFQDIPAAQFFERNYLSF